MHAERDGATYANIAGASPLPKGMYAPALFNEAVLIDVNSMPFEEIDELPEFLRDKIKSSEEYAARVRHQGNLSGAGTVLRPPRIGEDTGDINPDDIPF